MATRDKEKKFIMESIGKYDKNFFKRNCNGCHIKSCLDCHFVDTTTLFPQTNTCLKCHRKYFIGIEYVGLAIKDDNIRYQRGRKFKNDFYIKMREDIHYKNKISCTKCHNMKSFLKNKKSSMSCSSCHTPNKQIIEHKISEHMKNLECYACHSGWIAQEYGTFFIRKRHKQNKIFPIKNSYKGYIKSSFIKKYGYPPLGLNNKHKVSPIRPQFILYFTDTTHGIENRLLKAQWKAIFPHTIQKGSVTCDGCHFSSSRFLIRKNNIFKWKKMGLIDFFSQKHQYVENGSFYPFKKYKKISLPNKRFVRFYLKKWERILHEENL